MLMGPNIYYQIGIRHLAAQPVGRSRENHAAPGSPQALALKHLLDSATGLRMHGRIPVRHACLLERATNLSMA